MKLRYYSNDRSQELLARTRLDEIELEFKAESSA